jgi:hypothetical protein
VKAGAVPELDSPYEYPHEPCASTHAEGRRVLVLDVVVGAALIGGGLVLMVRRSRSRAGVEIEATPHAA